MDIEEWWPKLKPSTREWLIENNGDALSADALEEITQAGGTVTVGTSGSYLSDSETDWIEATANDEDG